MSHASHKGWTLGKGGPVLAGALKKRSEVARDACNIERCNSFLLLGNALTPEGPLSSRISLYAPFLSAPEEVFGISTLGFQAYGEVVRPFCNAPLSI